MNRLRYSLEHRIAGIQLSEWGMLAAILLIAAYLRLSDLDLTYFKYDDAYVANRAARMLDGESIPLLGMYSSMGARAPATFIYLMAIPLAISRDPAFATGFVGLLSVLTVGGAYLFGRRYFGRTAAYIAALLFATSPWSVNYSRNIQSQNVLPFFSLLLVWALMAGLRERKAWAQVAMPVILALAIQVHMIAVFLVPVVLVVLALNWRRAALPALGVGIALAALTFAPFVWGQYLSGWEDLRASANAPAVPATVDLEALHMVIGMASGPVYQNESGVSAPQFHAGQIDFGVLYSLEAGLLMLAIPYLAWLARRDGARMAAAQMLLAWGLVPPLLLARHFLVLSPHYLLIVYPMQFLAVGVLLADIIAWLRRHAADAPPLARKAAAGAAAALVLLVAVIAASQMYAFAYFIGFVDRYDTSGAHNLSIKDLKAAVTGLEAKAAEQGGPAYLSLEDRDFGEIFGFLARGKPNLRWFDQANAFAFQPSDSGRAVYLSPDGASPAGRLLEQHFQPAGSSGAPGRPLRFRYYQATPQSYAGLLGQAALSPLSLPMSNGFRLVGQHLPDRARAGETMAFTVIWETDQDWRPGDPEYVFALALLDADWKARATLDREGLPYSERRAGQRVINWYSMPLPADLPAGQYWIGVSVYQRPSVQRAVFLDAQGQPSGTVRRLGPVKIAAWQADSAVPAPQYAQTADLGGQVRLAGYDLETGSVRPGGEVRLRLYWQALAPVQEDYTIFVHLTDDAGRPVAQDDHQPRAGGYPTGLWDPGEWVVDDSMLRVPPGTEPGRYRLAVGMYRLATGERLAVDPPHNRVLLDRAVEVLPGG